MLNRNPMRRFAHLLGLVVLFVALCQCTTPSNNEFEDGERGIYGRITDYDTGQSVKNANVQLRPSGETTLTGSDGEYAFRNLKKGSYSITVSKAEYTELIDDMVIEVDSKMVRRDLRIEKLVASIMIVDNNNKPLDYLNFGEEATSMQFTIFNNGTISVNCAIKHSCPWVASVSNPTSPLAPGASCSIIVTIDRAKLKAGEQTDRIDIASNNGTNSVRISAIGKTVKPQVKTLPVTNADGTVGPWSDYFHGEITEVGNPPYTKRGFCFSSTNKTPIISDNPIEVPGTGIGEYSYHSDYFWNHPNKVKYYVRTWVKYGDDQIEYGNVVEFIYNNV